MFISFLYVFRATVPIIIHPAYQSFTQNNKYQVWHKYICFSWWWAHSRPKLVEKRNKHTEKNCAPSWFYLQAYAGMRGQLTYLLTPWSRVLFEKLTGFAASQEIPRIYGTWKFITVLTSARHLSLFWTRSIQFPQSPPAYWRSILMLSSHLCLGLLNGLVPSGFPTKTLCTPLSFPMMHSQQNIKCCICLWILLLPEDGCG
jgi:hypothetical protein